MTTYTVVVTIKDRATQEHWNVEVSVEAEKPWQALDAAADQIRSTLRRGTAVVGNVIK